MVLGIGHGGNADGKGCGAAESWSAARAPGFVDENGDVLGRPVGVLAKEGALLVADVGNTV